MALKELTRINFAVNHIIERCSVAVKLSRRAAIALTIMDVDAQPTMTNQRLHDLFILYKISTAQSAKKDSSAAKSELLEAKCIAIEQRVSIFAITESGRDVIKKLHEVMETAIDELGLEPAERLLLRSLMNPAQVSRRPPESSASGTPRKRARSGV